MALFLSAHVVCEDIRAKIIRRHPREIAAPLAGGVPLQVDVGFGTRCRGAEEITFPSCLAWRSQTARYSREPSWRKTGAIVKWHVEFALQRLFRPALSRAKNFRSRCVAHQVHRRTFACRGTTFPAGCAGLTHMFGATRRKFSVGRRFGERPAKGRSPTLAAVIQLLVEFLELRWTRRRKENAAATWKSSRWINV